jgi:hypothetical protein
MSIRKICPFLIQFSAFALVLPAAATTIAYNTSLASPTTNPATSACYAGTSGCLNGGFTVSSDGSTELGLRAAIRGKGLAPEVGNDYTVPLGTSGIYAIWNYSFSIDTRPNGVGTATLSSFTYLLTLTDLTTGKSNSFNPLGISDNYNYGPSGVTEYSFFYSPTKQWGAQNSENFNFSGFGTPGYNPNSTDGYQITLSEFSGSVLVNSDTILVNDTAPEPATIFLFGTGLLAAALIARRRLVDGRL